MPPGTEAIAILMLIWLISIPCALVFALVHWCVVSARSAQVENPVCGVCAYDVRGLIEPRCPECGTAFSAGGIRSREFPRPVYPLGILVVWITIFPVVGTGMFLGLNYLVPSQVRTDRDIGFRVRDRGRASGEYLGVRVVSHGYGPFLKIDSLGLDFGRRSSPEPHGWDPADDPKLAILLTWRENGTPTFVIYEPHAAWNSRSVILLTYHAPTVDELAPLLPRYLGDTNLESVPQQAKDIANLLAMAAADRSTLVTAMKAYKRNDDRQKTRIDPAMWFVVVDAGVVLTVGLGGFGLMLQRWHRRRLSRWRKQSSEWFTLPSPKHG